MWTFDKIKLNKIVWIVGPFLNVLLKLLHSCMPTPLPWKWQWRERGKGVCVCVCVCDQHLSYWWAPHWQPLLWRHFISFHPHSTILSFISVFTPELQLLTHTLIYAYIYLQLHYSVLYLFNTAYKYIWGWSKVLPFFPLYQHFFLLGEDECVV